MYLELNTIYLIGLFISFIRFLNNNQRYNHSFLADHIFPHYRPYPTYIYIYIYIYIL